MRVRGWRAAGLALALAREVLAPGLARSQAAVEITPSFSVAEVYDDNLFSTPSRRQKDLISRFTPGLEAGYRSPTLAFFGRYTFDAEVYLDHPELDDPQVRQDAVFGFRIRPTQLLALSLDASYAEAEIPGELNLETGLSVGRARAWRASANPSMIATLDPFTTGTASYTYTIDQLVGGVEGRTQVGDLRLDRRLTTRDTASLGYIYRQFTFDGHDLDTSHTATLGWTRLLTPLTTVSLRGGPRVSEEAVDPEVSASIHQRLKHGDLSLTYGRSETTVIGLADVVVSEAFTLAGTYNPLANLRLRAAPALFRSSLGDLDATVYAMDAEATYRIAKWLSLTGSYSFRLQRGSLDAGRPRDEEIVRNTILLKLTVVYPYRVY